MYLRQNRAIFIKTAHEEQVHFVCPEPCLSQENFIMKRLHMLFSSRSLILENTHDGNKIIVEPYINVGAMQPHNFLYTW